MSITAKAIIADAIDEFNVEDFVDPDFTAICADKIIADLEFRGFRILQFERASTPQPLHPARPEQERGK